VLEIDPRIARACTPGWDIIVIAQIPQKGITMKMKVGVILGQQLAIQADRFLETLDESCYPVTGSQMHIREQEAAGVCYLYPTCGHTSVDCPRLKSGEPQIMAECMDKWYQSTVNMGNLPRLCKNRKEPILDPGATRHQQAGSGIWHHDTPRKDQKQHYKKVTKYKSNANWQGSRRNDVEADNQVFGANEAEIKQKSLEAIRLLRQADQALDKICKFIADCTEYV